MATYLELNALVNNRDLRRKVETALFILALSIFNETTPPANQSERLKMANKIFDQPGTVAKSVLPSILAANSGLSVTQIENASDAAIQSNVDSIIDLFVDNLVNLV